MKLLLHTVPNINGFGCFFSYGCIPYGCINILRLFGKVLWVAAVREGIPRIFFSPENAMTFLELLFSQFNIFLHRSEHFCLCRTVKDCTLTTTLLFRILFMVDLSTLCSLASWRMFFRGFALMSSSTAKVRASVRIERGRPLLRCLEKPPGS